MAVPLVVPDSEEIVRAIVTNPEAFFRTSLEIISTGMQAVDTKQVVE